jgi:hypothetical protein
VLFRSRADCSLGRTRADCTLGCSLERWHRPRNDRSCGWAGSRSPSVLLEPTLPVWLPPHTLRPGEGDGGHAAIAADTGSNQVNRGRSFETSSSHRLSIRARPVPCI